MTVQYWSEKNTSGEIKRNVTSPPILFIWCWESSSTDGLLFYVQSSVEWRWLNLNIWFIRAFNCDAEISVYISSNFYLFEGCV